MVGQNKTLIVLSIFSSLLPPPNITSTQKTNLDNTRLLRKRRIRQKGLDIHKEYALTPRQCDGLPFSTLGKSDSRTGDQSTFPSR